MQYSIITTGGRFRLTSTFDGELTVVTTLAEATAKEEAKQLARALTCATSNLPYQAYYLVAREHGDDYVGPVCDAFCSPLDPAVDHWYEAPAQVTSKQWNRLIGAQVAAGEPLQDFGGYDQLPVLVARQPESVRRAVLDEVAAAWKPYDGVLVVARVHDYKWHDVDDALVVNAALATLSEAGLDDLERNPASGEGLLRVMEKNQLADLAQFDAVDASGYLRTEVNLAQLRAWRAQRAEK